MIRKVIILLFSLFVMLPLTAEKVTVPIKTYKGKSGQVDQPVLHRSPIYLPIEVIYDNETMTLEILCTTDIEGEVSVYNSYEELEGYSPFINTVIQLMETGYHYIVIEGDDWISTGVIE